MKFPTESAITGPRELRDPRSREYAIQTMRSLKRFLESKTFDAKHIADELQLIEQYKHWEVLGFKDLDTYVRTEVGISLKQLRSRLAQDLAADPSVMPLATAAEAGAMGGKGKKALDNIKSFGGTSASYLVRRLKRDAPEIAEALARGEFKSARAAGIAAGIIKVPTQLERFLAMLPKLTEEERREIWLKLNEEFSL